MSKNLLLVKAGYGVLGLSFEFIASNFGYETYYWGTMFDEKLAKQFDAILGGKIRNCILEMRTYVDKDGRNRMVPLSMRVVTRKQMEGYINEFRR